MTCFHNGNIVGKKTLEDHSEHLGSKPNGAYESDIGKKTANPAEVNQIWRTSGKSNALGASWEPHYEPAGVEVNQIWRTSGKSYVHGASCEPLYEPVGAEVNQTWRTSKQSNVRGVSWEPPYESVGA